MIDLRRLAAIDIALVGYRLIVAEYAFGVLFSIALGVFVLMRTHSGWQEELRDKPAAMARYRRISLVLLVPAVPVVFAVIRHIRKMNL